MTDKELSRIMRAAWSTHRLNDIREMTRQVIELLRSADPRDVLGRDLSMMEATLDGCVSAALETCCDELRDGCGMTLRGSRVVAGPPQGALADSWARSYSIALGHYRDRAGVTLQGLLTVAGGPG